MIPGDQLYEKQLGFSYWFVTHKPLLKSILTIALLVLDILLIVYFLYLLIFNLVIYRRDYQANLASLIAPVPDYTFLRQFNLPPAISVANIQTYANNSGYDIVADISNSSPAWLATFDYQFQLGEKLTDSRKGFILPGETKRIIDLAVADGNLATNVIFSNVNWQKEINFAKLKEERFKFEIRNVKFIPAQELGVGQKIPVSRVSFEVENLSAYNYKNINWQLYLNSGGQITAINQIPSGQLLSGSTEVFEVNFFQRLPKIDKVAGSRMFASGIISTLSIFGKRWKKLTSKTSVEPLNNWPEGI